MEITLIQSERDIDMVELWVNSKLVTVVNIKVFNDEPRIVKELFRENAVECFLHPTGRKT